MDWTGTWPVWRIGRRSGSGCSKRRRGKSRSKGKGKGKSKGKGKGKAVMAPRQGGSEAARKGDAEEEAEVRIMAWLGLVGSSSIASATACGAAVQQRSAELNNSRDARAAGPMPSASAARGATARSSTGAHEQSGGESCGGEVGGGG